MFPQSRFICPLSFQYVSCRTLLLGLGSNWNISRLKLVSIPYKCAYHVIYFFYRICNISSPAVSRRLQQSLEWEVRLCAADREKASYSQLFEGRELGEWIIWRGIRVIWLRAGIRVTWLRAGIRVIWRGSGIPTRGKYWRNNGRDWRQRWWVS